MRNINKYWLTGTLIALCWLFHGTSQVAKGKILSDVTSDDAVLRWNEIAVTTIGAQPPFPSTRFMATVQVAVFEAVNAISGKYEPYLGTIVAPEGASTQAADHSITCRAEGVLSGGCAHARSTTRRFSRVDSGRTGQDRWYRSRRSGCIRDDRGADR